MRKKSKLLRSFTYAPLSDFFGHLWKKLFLVCFYPDSQDFEALKKTPTFSTTFMGRGAPPPLLAKTRVYLPIPSLTNSNWKTLQDIFKELLLNSYKLVGLRGGMSTSPRPVVGCWTVRLRNCVLGKKINQSIN